MSVCNGASTGSYGSELADSVVSWFRDNGREFPWRETKNPFHILLAEVLLRQTQATRVVSPYLELIARYPDPESLAHTDVTALRHWFRPLGLVERADRLVESARILVQEHGGQVPGDVEGIEALPGLGRYSARAIACLAFGRAVPMIDEGSGRVLRRVLALKSYGPAYSSRPLMEEAQRLLPQNSARDFNLGLLDIAARLCRPRRPLCSECPLLGGCAYARALGAPG